MLPLTATFLVLGGRQSEIRTRNAVNLAFFSTSLLQLSRSQSSFLCQSFHKRYTLFRKRSLSPRPPLAEILKFTFEKIFRLAPLGGSRRTFKFFFQFTPQKIFRLASLGGSETNFQSTKKCAPSCARRTANFTCLTEQAFYKFAISFYPCKLGNMQANNSLHCYKGH